MIGTVVAAVLVFARLGGLLSVLPGVGAGAVPAFARLAAALPLTLLVLPAVGTVAAPPTLSRLLLAVAGEAFLGLAMGMAVSLLFGALAAAAELLSTQGGLQLAALLDPVTLTQPGAVGVLATWLGTGVFLGAGLHLRCLEAVAVSFHALPPGALGDPGAAAAILVPEAGAAIAAGATLAGPITLFVFTVNLGLSLLGRMAPNLQLFFAVGPSVTVVACLALLGISLPSLLSAWYALLPDTVRAIEAIAALAAGR